MKKLIAFIVAAATSAAVFSAIRILSISAVPVVISSCAGDSCDIARQKCDDKGLTATDCKKTTKADYVLVRQEECECECVK